MSEVALNLENYTGEGKIAFSAHVGAQMTLNAQNFPGGGTVIQVLGEKRTSFAEAMAAEMAAQSAWTVARASRIAAEEQHDLQLKVTATFAEQVTGFDGPKLESGGFTLAKPSLPIGPLPAPLNLRSVAGAAPGSADISCKSVNGGKTYQGQCAPSPTGPWTDVYNGTRARFTATGLTSGTLYYFRMAVTGTAGQSPWSDITEKRAP
jgi:hypothetical protein